MDQDPKVPGGVEEVAGAGNTSAKPSFLQYLAVMFGPSLGSIESAVHCPVQFPHHVPIGSIGVLIRELNKDISDSRSIEVCPAHIN